MEKCKIVLGALFSLGTAVDMAKANDGKITVTDLGLLVGPATQLPGAVAAAKEAGEEWKSADDAARAELVAWLKATFDIANDNLEKKIEAGLAILIDAGEFFQA